MAPKPGIATSLLLLEHKDHEPPIQGRQASASGIYVFKDAEIVDYAAPYGVFSELDAFIIADAMRPMQTQAGFTVLPNYSFLDRPDMDAFLIPGGFGTRQETHNGRLHDFIRMLPEKTLLSNVCTGSWIYGAMGLLDRKPATNRKEPVWLEASKFREYRSTNWRRSRPQPASPAPAWSMPGSSSARAASLQAWRWASTCSAAQAMTSRCEVARVMEYKAAYDLYKDDVEYADA